MNKMMLKKQYMMYSPKKKGRLPSDFQEVEYIESTGTQYIDTGVLQTNSIGTFVDIQFTNNQIETFAPFLETYDGTNNPSYLSIKKATNFGLYNATTYGYYGEFIPYETTSSFARHTYEYSNGNWLLDNVLVGSDKSITYNTNLSLYLFGMHRISGAMTISIAKLYSCKLYDNNVLVRDFIPCYRKSDNEVGMYDIVNNQFYTNSGSGTFLMGRPLVYDTIQGYQQVDYIESTGTQYIDSGYVPSATTKTQVTCIFTKKGSNYMGITGYETNGRNTFGINANGYSYFGAANQNDFGNTDVIDKKLTWEIDNINKTYTNGEYSGTWSNTYSNTLSLPFYFFVRCDYDNGFVPQNTEIGYGWLKFYEAKFYENNVLVRHFIPMRRLSDNELGLYDLVNGVFYTNQGSGEFLSGVDIVNIDGYKQLGYIESSGTQYIDTGLTPNGNYSFDIKINASTIKKSILGGLEAWEQNAISLYINNYNNLLWSFANKSKQATHNSFPLNTDIQITSNRGTLRAGNEVVILDNSSFNYTGRNIILFGTNGPLGPVEFVSMKLYYCKWYDGNVLIRNFIPMCRLSDNKLGLYDLVNKEFYTNQGSGSFIAGEFLKV